MPKAFKHFKACHLAVAALVLSSCVTPTQSPFLSKGEIEQLVPGNSFAYDGFTFGKPFSGDMTFQKSGNLVVKTDSGIPESGSWRIANDRLCTRLTALYNGRERCFQIERKEDGQYFTSHGFWIAKRG